MRFSVCLRHASNPVRSASGKVTLARKEMVERVSRKRARRGWPCAAAHPFEPALAGGGGPVGGAVPGLFRAWLSPADPVLRRRHRRQRRAQCGAGDPLSAGAPPHQPRGDLLSGLRRAAAGGAALSDRRHRQSLRPDVPGAGGDRGRHAQSRQYADPGGHRLCLGVADRGVASPAALADRRNPAAAAALSGRHLGLAGDRHRLHLDLCLAHRQRNRRACRRDLRPPSWRWRANTAWRRSARWPPRRRTSWARRWAPSRWWRASWNARCRKIPPEAEDVRLLREQAERCRTILARLANPEEALLGVHRPAAAGRLPGRHRRSASRRGLGDRVTVTPPEDDSQVPQVWRAPELLHGLGNIIENAADFATSAGSGQCRLGRAVPLYFGGG